MSLPVVRTALETSVLLICWLVVGAAFAQPAPEEAPAPDEGLADTFESPPSTPPQASRPTSLTLADEGTELHLRGDYEAAQSKLEQAHAQLPLPTVGIWLARNLDRLGRLLDAQARYRAIAEEDERTTTSTLAAAARKGLAPPGLAEQKKAKDDAALELGDLVDRIPTMVVVVSGDDGQAELRLDDGPAPLGEARQLDPGPYRVEGTLGDQTVVRAVVLHERDRAIVGVPFGPEPSSGSNGTAQAVVGWVLVGVGGAAAIGGGILAGIAAARLGDLDCLDNQCQPSQREDMDAYNGLRLPSGFLLVGGGLLAATGVAIVLNAPSDHEDRANVSIVLGPGMFGLTGAF